MPGGNIQRNIEIKGYIDNPNGAEYRIGGVAITATAAELNALADSHFVAPMILGGTSQSYTDPAEIIVRTIGNAVGSSSHGYVDQTQINSGESYAGFDCQITVLDGESYAGKHFAPFQSNGSYAGSGDLDTWYGFSHQFTHTGTGTITDWYGSRILDPIVSGGGAIENSYGLRIANVNSGTVSNWGLYMDGGQHFIGGSLLINDDDDTPDARLVVKSLSPGNAFINWKRANWTKLLEAWEDAGSDLQLLLNDNTGALKIKFDTGNTSYINNGAAFGIGTAAPSANAALTLGSALCLPEITTPTADASKGKIYCKSDDKLYFQDGAGAEHEVAFV